MSILEEIYRFETANFVLIMNALVEHDPDVSWDESGETGNKIDSGEWVIFTAQCVIFTNDELNTELASSYLGNCIYEEYANFRDNVGLNVKSRKANVNYGSYFSDMVRETCREARIAWNNRNPVKLKLPK